MRKEDRVRQLIILPPHPHGEGTVKSPKRRAASRGWLAELTAAGATLPAVFLRRRVAVEFHAAPHCPYEGPLFFADRAVEG